MTLGESGSGEGCRLLVAIPTRDRADLAVRAIDSVLCQRRPDVAVLVSDNSTCETDRDRLACHSAALSASHRLDYVRPPRPMPMSAHWNWVLEHAMQRGEYTHVCFLTDRMMFRPRALPALVGLAAAHPGAVITYHLDTIVDYQRPIRVRQSRWTGKLLEVDCLHLSRLYARAAMHPCLPRLLNCVVPRPVLAAVAERFGDYCSSISPDYNFGFRCLELLDSILFWDASPIVQYSLASSSGGRVTRLATSAPLGDYVGNWDDAVGNRGTPIPLFVSAGNAVFHEYCLFRDQTASHRFFALDVERYLRYLTTEIDSIEEAARRAEMKAMIVAYRRRRGRLTAVGALLADPLVLVAAWWRAYGPGSARPSLQAAWGRLHRLSGGGARDDGGQELDDLDAAIDHLARHPRPPSRRWPLQEWRLRARELGRVTPWGM
jgi:glycosyl transferase family 2